MCEALGSIPITIDQRNTSAYGVLKIPTRTFTVHTAKIHVWVPYLRLLFKN